MKVKWARRAIFDIQNHISYIRLHSPASAARIALEIDQAGESLSMMPDRGRPGDIPGTRELVVVWPYIIVYQIEAEHLEILRVWHGAQDREPL